jgi:hypothetical protein
MNTSVTRRFRSAYPVPFSFLLTSLLEVPLVQAAQNVVPVAVIAGDKIEGLRQWASGRCLSADRAGVYSRLESGGGGRVRRVMRETEAGVKTQKGAGP